MKRMKQTHHQTIHQAQIEEMENEAESYLAAEKEFLNFVVTVKQFHENNDELISLQEEEQKFEKFKIHIKQFKLIGHEEKGREKEESILPDDVTPLATEKFYQETADNQVQNLNFSEFLEKDQREMRNTPSYKQFAEFTKFRFSNEERNGRINMQVCDLKEVIQICYRKQMISKEVFKKFYLNYQFIGERNFLELEQKKIKSINFRKCLFTLLDHRLFCQAILTNYPHQFEMRGKPLTLDAMNNKYLNFIYGLSAAQYVSYYESFNEIYERFWMPKNLQTLENFKLQITLGIDGNDEFEYMNKNGRKMRKRITDQ